ncbi:hypothetical protein PYW07_012670 [Mythimna separata]|uniref:Uncharacterized protein n=1 Tax=Mythimna separata TaxID=271217 RepID=A0AAD7Y921_MYTSE|nr:hypothetical protein PYW07_012670 [Mythimna separata]
MPTPSYSPRRGNNLTEYFSKSGAENTATSMHPPRRENNLTDYFSKSGAGNKATTTFSPRRAKQKVTPNIPFHRRFNYMHDSERNKPQKWVHCLDLITPKLQGMKEESRKKVVSSNDSDVRRLAQLIFTDVSKFNAEDMVSILSQISKIRIRMYQWDQNAITMIFNIIIKGSVHSFHTLKAGVKELIAKWHLDLSMMRVFLEQTRIFRPPCIDITGYQGFSKKPGGVIPYTKPDKPKKYRDPNVSCQSKEKHEPYDNENP